MFSESVTVAHEAELCTGAYSCWEEITEEEEGETKKGGGRRERRETHLEPFNL